MMLDRSEPKQSYRFWETQPVDQFEGTASTSQAQARSSPGSSTSRPDGPIREACSVADVRQEPYPLVDQFEWCVCNLQDEADLTAVFDLLRLNYVEDDDAMFRFCYSRDFLKWALCPPGYKTDWHIGVRVKASQKLVRAPVTAIALPAQARCAAAGRPGSLRHRACQPPPHTAASADPYARRAAGGLHLGHPREPARQRHRCGHRGDQFPLRAQEAARQAPHARAHQGGDAQGQPLRRVARGVHGGRGHTQARGDVPLLPPLNQPQEARRHWLLELQRAHHHGAHDPAQQAPGRAADRRRAPACVLIARLRDTGATPQHHSRPSGRILVDANGQRRTRQ